MGVRRFRVVLLHAPLDRSVCVFSSLQHIQTSRLSCQVKGLPHWFLTVRVITVLDTAEVGAGFSLAHAATAALLAVVTVLTILMTELFNTYRKGQGVFSGVTGMLRRGLICAFAGFLALSVFNILLLIVLGTRHNPGTSSHKKDELHSQRGVGHQAVPTSTHAPAATGLATGTNPGYSGGGAGATMV